MAENVFERAVGGQSLGTRPHHRRGHHSGRAAQKVDDSAAGEVVVAEAVEPTLGGPGPVRGDRIAERRDEQRVRDVGGGGAASHHDTRRYGRRRGGERVVEKQVAQPVVGQVGQTEVSVAAERIAVAKGETVAKECVRQRTDGCDAIVVRELRSFTLGLQSDLMITITFTMLSSAMRVDRLERYRWKDNLTTKNTASQL